MLLRPIHIATRGKLDGEYGIATRGYIILPDIVFRIPSVAMVGEASFVPVALVSSVSSLEFEAKISTVPDFVLVFED